MKKETIKINKIVADEGYVFAKPDKSEVYSDILFLGKNDKPENYIEISLEEAESIKAEQDMSNPETDGE